MFKLILKIKPEKDIDYYNFIRSYPRYFNAFLYQNSKTLFKLHDKKRYKYITFTKPFKVKNNKLIASELYTIIIKTSDKSICTELYNNLKSKNKPFFLGEGEFKIQNITRKYSEGIKNFDTVVFLTPIVLTKKINNKINSITYESNKEEFLKSLQSNMIKKYNSYFETDIPEDFKVLNNVVVESKGSFSVPTGFNKSFYVGSELILRLGVLSNIQRRIIQFSYNVGFGEKTALGFGFPDLKRKYSLDEFKEFNNIINVNKSINVNY